MNIAFWSEEHQSGTTTHLRAITEVMSVLCPKQKLMSGGTLSGGDGEIHFFDCGSGFSARKRHVLWHADLVVVSLRRERRCVEQFFMQDFHISDRLIYLLGGYPQKEAVDRRYLERVYRVDPEYIGEIPFCNGFYDALQKGAGEAYLRRELASAAGWSGQSGALLQELRRIALLIERLADEAERDRQRLRQQEERLKARKAAKTARRATYSGRRTASGAAGTGKTG